MTNREWLQTLTDEEFAKWNYEIGCGSCAYNSEKGFCNNLTGSVSFETDRCINGTERWLKQEHKEETK